jgi:hypothetical protein
MAAQQGGNMNESKLENKQVSIKIVGVDLPKPVNVKSWTDRGIWLQSETLHNELAILAKEPAVAGFLGRNPLIFLPLHRLEWVMVAEKETH